MATLQSTDSGTAILLHGTLPEPAGRFVNRLHTGSVAGTDAGRSVAAHRRPVLQWFLSRRTLAGLWCLALAVFTLPPAIAQPGVGLDPSWELGLNMAVRQHLQWGTQVIWTFGPYGFTSAPRYYYFSTWLIGLLLRLAVHAILFAVLTYYLISLRAGPWRWVLVGALFLLPVVAFITFEYETELAVMLLLYLSAINTRMRSAIRMAALAGSLIALLLMIKGTGIVIVATFLVTYGAFVLAIRRSLLLITLIGSAGLSLLALWTLAGQSFVNLYAYFRSSYEIISGYTAAMSVLYEYPTAYVWQRVAFAAIVFISLIGLLAWALLRRDRPLVCLLVLATPLLLAICKFGFVRFGNQIYFYALAVVIETLILVRMIPPGRGVRMLAPMLQPTAIAAASLVLISGVGYASGAVPRAPEWPASQLKTRLTTYLSAAAVVAHPDRRADRTAMTSAAIRAADPLRPQTVAALSKGRTDVWPWDIDILYAYSLRWAPRPVLQSYAAYTTYLDESDAAHLKGPAAPDNVLIALREGDHRYFAFDEPAAFRALREHYHVEGQDGDFLVLSKRAQGESTRLRPAETVHARLGDVVTVPPSANGRVYASVSVPYSVRGQFMNAAFQPGELHIRFQLADRSTQPYRFIQRVAADGLMFDTYIENQQDLRSYLEGRRDHPIRAFQLTSDSPADYTGRVDITFLTTD